MGILKQIIVLYIGIYSFFFDQSNCDFVVWTPNGYTVLLLLGILVLLTPVIKEFYCKHIIPELLT